MPKLEQANKDLIKNCVIGKMCWYGETYADQESLNNMEAGYELILLILDDIYDNATLAKNAIDTYSGNVLNKRSIDMLKNIRDICNEVVKD